MHLQHTHHALLYSPLYACTCAHRKFFTFHDSADRYRYMRHEKSKIFFTLVETFLKFQFLRIILTKDVENRSALYFPLMIHFAIISCIRSSVDVLNKNNK